METPCPDPGPAIDYKQSLLAGAVVLRQRKKKKVKKVVKGEGGEEQEGEESQEEVAVKEEQGEPDQAVPERTDTRDIRLLYSLCKA